MALLDTTKSFKTKATWMSEARVGRLHKASGDIVRSGEMLRRLVLRFMPRTGDPRSVTAQGHTANARSLTSNWLKRPLEWEPSPRLGALGAAQVRLTILHLQEV